MPEEINVPLLDLKAQYETIRDEIEPILREVVESQWFVMGPKVADFESSVAEHCGTDHAVGCASGSDALLLALMALDIGPGDEVICPSYTFFATAGSIWRLGATPVFCDIDPGTYNCTTETVAEAASRCSRLKAIMPVHLFGQAVDLDGLLTFAESKGVPVIEDAAQAIGSRDAGGTRVGSRGQFGCFSFFPSKNLGGFGDGGIVTTNDGDMADRMRRLRNHGMEPKYYHQEVGLNSRLDALQAAVLQVKLRHLDDWTEGRRRNATDYDQMFDEAGAGSSGTSLEGADLPLLRPSCPAAPSHHIYNQYVIRVPAAIRDELRAHLVENRIGHDVYYPVPLHAQDCFKQLAEATGPLLETETAAAQTIALPVYPELTMEQKRHVAETIIAFVRARAAVQAS
ncbi:MAG: DegT/DnrJ/EryC1/StrS family aminotransferase [Planctomycetota bacterium]|nr:DegT/DnrJ/EryC1/StrS family aminotransferase [Planctomycetota bacterium]